MVTGAGRSRCRRACPTIAGMSEFSADAEGRTELARFSYEVRAVVPFQFGEQRIEYDAAPDEALYGFASEYERELRREIEMTTTRLFGANVRAEVTVRQGSVLIDVLLYGWPVILMAKQIIETLRWYYDGVHDVIRRIFGRFRRHAPGGVVIEVTGSWTPSVTALQKVAEAEREPKMRRESLLLVYLVASNMLLLGLLVALVIAKAF